jgi:hypothetical protein
MPYKQASHTRSKAPSQGMLDTDGVFTTNYDLVIEHALAGLPYANGWVDSQYTLLCPVYLCSS